jgi:PHP family Zn ribbon phosphoesterase
MCQMVVRLVTHYCMKDTIDCLQPGWKEDLKTELQNGREAKIINFNYTVDGQFCEAVAAAHHMVLTLDSKAHVGSFKKRENN